MPLLAAVACAAIGLRELATSHPHEDAYILFRYARHVAEGRGIVFDAGGPRAEGATDFLWMLLLSGTARLGLDVAVAAVLWNAAGAALATAVFVRAIARSSLDGAARLAAALASACVLGSSAAVAGWAGFGTTFYAGLVLLLAELALADRPRARRATHVVALLVALTRPDGAVLATLFSAVALARAARARELGRDAAWALGAALAGAAYFAWRRAYFGLDLPLPLYVKAHGAEAFTLAGLVERPFAVLPGLRSALSWCTSRLGPAPWILLAAVGAFACAPRTRRAAVGLALVAAVFVLALAFGRPTQNYALRFQAPATLLCALAAWRVALAPELPARAARWLAGALLLAALPGVERAAEQLAWNERGASYMDVFPAELARLLPADATIALTEAGRLPYWTDARCIDVVGLNDPVFALRPPRVEDLEREAPDVVFFHVADALRFGGAPTALRAIERTDLAPHVTAAGRAAFDTPLERYPAGSAPENVAPAVLARFLADHANYHIVLARYEGEYRHVWAFRTDLPQLAELLTELEANHTPSAWRPYIDVARSACMR
ncbi:MAG: hypothetical protein IPJ77_01480 [Planctomycetes bacterium]|nr:hypothetical protein [Planctomycetota bacterium]